MKTLMTVLFVLALAVAVPARSEAQVRVEVRFGVGHPSYGYGYGHGYRYGYGYSRYHAYPERVVIVPRYVRPAPVIIVRNHHHRVYRRW